MRRLLALTSLLAIASAASAAGSTISVSGSGTFSASTPSSAFSGPSQAWNFSFLVNSNPAVSNVGAGSGFDAAFSNFSYHLNGSPVAITPTFIHFTSSAVQGMFEICFVSTCTPASGGGFSFAGQQMYSGAESSPTILAGSFTSTIFDVFLGTALYPQANVTVPAAGVPEPMTLSLMGAGLLGLGVLRRYRKV